MRDCLWLQTLIAKYAPGAADVAEEWDIVPNTAVPTHASLTAS